MAQTTESIHHEDIAERIDAGVEWLDDTLGKAWVWHVDPTHLILSSSCECVLGQLAPEVVKAYPEQTDAVSTHSADYYSFLSDSVLSEVGFPDELLLDQVTATTLGFYDDHLLDDFTDPWRRRISDLRQERGDLSDAPITWNVEEYTGDDGSTRKRIVETA